MSNSDAISMIVVKFYDKATQDVLIGYHFTRIKDFTSHLEHISSFWQWHLLKTPYPAHFPPIRLMAKHLPLGIKVGELHRWVKLFHETLDENTNLLEPEMLNHWREKIEEFKSIFLQNKMLFAFSG
jgi:truncated hemoglobin YjbI